MKSFRNGSLTYVTVECTDCRMCCKCARQKSFSRGVIPGCTVHTDAAKLYLLPKKPNGTQVGVAEALTDAEISDHVSWLLGIVAPQLKPTKLEERKFWEIVAVLRHYVELRNRGESFANDGQRTFVEPQIEGRIVGHTSQEIAELIRFIRSRKPNEQLCALFDLRLRGTKYEGGAKMMHIDRDTYERAAVALESFLRLWTRYDSLIRSYGDSMKERDDWIKVVTDRLNTIRKHIENNAYTLNDGTIPNSKENTPDTNAAWVLQWVWEYVNKFREDGLAKESCGKAVPPPHGVLTKPKGREFMVGDVIAYRTLEDGEPEWVVWEVGEIDAKYLYANAEKNNNIQDNVAKDCAYLVMAAEVAK